MIMRKITITFCFIMILSILLTGCTGTKKSENEIREIAYHSLDDYSKNTIINWENAEVEEFKSPTEMHLGNSSVNIEGKETYRITFNVQNEAVLGPIVMFVDKDSYKISGVGLRD